MSIPEHLYPVLVSIVLTMITAWSAYALREDARTSPLKMLLITMTAFMALMIGVFSFNTYSVSKWIPIAAVLALTVGPLVLDMMGVYKHVTYLSLFRKAALLTVAILIAAPVVVVVSGITITPTLMLINMILFYLYLMLIFSRSRIQRWSGKPVTMILLSAFFLVYIGIDYGSQLSILPEGPLTWGQMIAIGTKTFLDAALLFMGAMSWGHKPDPMPVPEKIDSEHKDS